MSRLVRAVQALTKTPSSLMLLVGVALLIAFGFAVFVSSDAQADRADIPALAPTKRPPMTQTNVPTKIPPSTATNTPTDVPTNTPTFTPTNTATNTPTVKPSNTPTNTPTVPPSNTP